MHRKKINPHKNNVLAILIAFQLEKRFHLNDGSHYDGRMFNCPATVGLAGPFGHIRLGHVNRFSDETFRKLDPWRQYGVAGAHRSWLGRNVAPARRVLNNIWAGSPAAIAAAGTTVVGYPRGWGYSAAKAAYFLREAQKAGIPASSIPASWRYMAGINRTNYAYGASAAQAWTPTDYWGPGYGAGNGIYGDAQNLAARTDNTIRWDSPRYYGLQLNASYILKPTAGEDISHKSQEGYAVGINYQNGPIFAFANYERGTAGGSQAYYDPFWAPRLAQAGKSTKGAMRVNYFGDGKKDYLWNVGVAVKVMDCLRLSLGYEQTSFDGYDILTFDEGGIGGIDHVRGYKQRNALFGLEWSVGTGQVNFSYNYESLKDASGKLHQIGIGYDHHLSKRTTLYAIYAYSKYSNDYNLNYGFDKSVIHGVQVGINHKF